MIAWIDRLLVRWAEAYRLGGCDLAGLGYPSGSAQVVVMEPSRARRRGNDRKRAAVLRAGLSGGVTAHGVATRPGKGVSKVVMPADVQRLDQVICADLGADWRRLLEVVYVDNYHSPEEKAGLLGVSLATMYRRLDVVHERLERLLRPSAELSVDAELAALEDKLSRCKVANS